MSSISFPLLASACLCGIVCRYDGKSTGIDSLVALYKEGKVIPICPEVDGGLSIPRPPCELIHGRAMTAVGEDMTDAFTRGAQKALEKALANNVSIAILKEKSPSCGISFIYDGSFSKTLIKGEGITAALLRAHGILLYNEHTIPF